MNGKHDKYANQRDTPEKMWPSARHVEYIGPNIYSRDGGGE